MIALKHIVWPTDLSDGAGFALDHAVALAAPFEAELTALHVATARHPGTHEALLAELAAALQPATAAGVRARAIVKEGNPVRVILAHAAESSADLLVMGTHGRGGFDRLLLGSVTEKILRRAGCPVMTVPRRSGPPVSADRIRSRRILCPVDFSACSAKALEMAFSLARATGAGLTLLHVVEWPLEWDITPSSQFNTPAFAHHLQERSVHKLREIAGGRPKGIAEPEVIVSSGKAYREILRIAGERQTGIIVMGVQGRAALDLMLFGSTTHHVVRAAACPVLTIRE